MEQQCSTLSAIRTYPGLICSERAERLIPSCRKAFTAKALEVDPDEGYSVGSTFFVRANEAPKSLLEGLAMEIFHKHTTGLGVAYDSACSGAEWCKLVVVVA